MDRPPQIVAFGGGGFSMESGPLLDDHVLRLTGVERPRVCFLPTASGDADHYIVRFYRAFAARAEASHVSLFRRDRGGGAVEGDLRGHLLAQDLIYVGGGSVVSLLGTWLAHGVDLMLEEAWRGGTVLCGLSAGSLCWFEDAVTAFHGAPRAVRGLGLLPWSNCVHYDGEPAPAGSFLATSAAGMRPGLRGGGRGRAALRRAPSSSTSSPRARRPGRAAWRRWAGGRSRRGWPPVPGCARRPCSRVGLADDGRTAADLRHGRAAVQRWSRRTLRSTSTSSR
jgi:peptidase E